MMASLLRRNPLVLLWIPFWFLKGRVHAKARLVEYTTLEISALPYNKDLLSFAQKEAQTGRQLILATGTDQRLAEKIAAHFGIFQSVIGSHGKTNMTGSQKARALLDRFGPEGFDYAGDSPVDLAVWQASRKALVICPKAGVLKQVLDLKSSEDIHHIAPSIKCSTAFLMVLRPWFWLLNLSLLLSPALFVGLSFLTSGLFIFGDLLYLEEDRKTEPAKSIFAQGYLHLNTAFMLVVVLIFASSFCLSSIGMGYGGTYALSFITLDRATRSLTLPIRWGMLALLQIAFIVLLGTK
jgi:hypothetical protein